ncbi:alkaline phosphatase D family protein [Roseivivax sediminis]|uniref:PhoD-like phosphatase n=1 Tax=Roseivivax sediminis TaxID=936889 RepID=A0A1I1UKU2_9RHOB|nr:alkaline phosphatase D family protein [Roseivivax sediminis]SFD68580.1 PhoD-like phosphatase [Roseivivax sediminis]
MAFGPVLILRAVEPSHIRLAAMICRDDAAEPAPLRAGGADHAPVRLAEIDGRCLWRYDFELPRGGRPDYSLDGRTYRVATDYDDLRIGFVSCNGEEDGDLDRDAEERNVMWRRLADTNETAPYHLLLHGGDQVYADEVTKGHRLSEDWPDDVPQAATPEALADLEAHLRRRFLDRYDATYSAPGFARIAAEVPSLMMWDDHDICDGWGSLGEVEGTAVGQTLFGCAREAFLLYQHAATDADVSELFLDPEGRSLSWRRDLPGVTILAPDLRSERTRERILGPAGWAAFTETCEDVEARVVLVSSVPLLGPRLSLIERAMRLTRRMEKYEDDLRDQWQSYAHRKEWVRMLRQVLALEDRGHRVVAISGEIHLATRAELAADATPVHQLVASGISHRAPPKLWALFLGTLARLGEAPIQKHPIRIRPLPGQRHNYTAERNYLTLAREGGEWRASWALEKSGDTPWLSV